MLDLRLFRLLNAEPLDADEVLPLLRQLGQRPLAERAAFLGRVGPLTAHPAPAMRAAALSALSGAHGYAAFRWLIAGLADDEESVRVAALEALRVSCREGDAVRWVHALFHPRPEMRRAALARDGFPLPWSYKLHLIADDGCREAILSELEQQGATSSVVPLLFDLLRAGQMSAERVCKLTRAMPWNAWLGFLQPLLPRRDDLSSRLMHVSLAPQQPQFEDEPADRLDELLTLFWDDGDGFFATLHNAALSEGKAFQQWIALRLLRHTARVGRAPQQAIDTAVVLWPWLIGCRWLEGREKALAAFYDAAGRCPRFKDDNLVGLLDGPPFWRGGVPDLYAMGALLHAFDAAPYHALMKRVPKASILAAVEADFERSVSILRVPDRTAEGRRKLLELLTVDRDTHGPRMLAVLASVVPADQLDFLDPLDGPATLAVFRAFLLLEQTRTLSDNKVARLASRLAARLAPVHVGDLLREWLTRPDPAASAIAPAVLGRVCADGHANHVNAVVSGLPLELLAAFLKVLPFVSGFPYDAETDLALILRGHADADVSTWARRRLGGGTAVVAPVVRGPRSGVVASLKSAAAEPNVGHCVALLACHDDPTAVTDLLARFCPDDEGFVKSLDCEMVRLWRGEMGLPFLGHVWLYRWDAHEAWIVRQFEPDTLVARVGGLTSVKSVAVRRRLADALGAVLDAWRWKDKARWGAALTAVLGEALLELLKSPLADFAVRRLVLWKDHGANPALQDVRARLALIAGELPPEVVRALGALLDARAVIVTAAGPAAVKGVAAFGDIEALVRDASSPDDTVAAPAARRLLMMGPQGAEALAGVINRHPELTWPPAVLAELVGARPVVHQALRRLVFSTRAAPRVRLRVAQKLWPSPELEMLETLLDALRQPGPTDWLTRADVEWLVKNYPGPEREACLVLIESPHPAAYGHAVAYLSALKEVEREALLKFLEAGSDRLRVFRVQAAEALYRAGERAQGGNGGGNTPPHLAVLPVLLGEVGAKEYPELLAGLDAAAVEDAACGVLALGKGETVEGNLLKLLDFGHATTARGWTEIVAPASGPRVDPEGRQRALALVLDQCRTASVRKEARDRLTPGASRTHKLRTLAKTFAWGIRLGRQLTGELFDIEMIAGEDLGYTRLNEKKLFISPMPILRGEQDGREVVKGLILHEYGHHVYHKSPGSLKVWERANRERMHPLLNLVSDEHLERNLRSKDESYDEFIKTLDAYGFQHAAREVGVDELLHGLGGRAFAVLTQTEMQAARQQGCVRLSAGGLLHRMERAGLSFARFMRALRMGLGNRYQDEKVGQGLALFKGPFRDASMERMYEIARELKKIFGDETDLLNCIGQDGVMCGSEDELIVLGEGITNDELQRAVQRALEEPGDEEPEKGNPVRTINLGQDLDFPLIELIQPMAFDPRKYARYARQVSRQAAALRQYLTRLGLAMVPQRQRVQGKLVDRARLRGLVLHGDPRILIARRTEAKTDLFLGVVIDCSGSMAIDKNIEKAKLFGALLAEASRGLRGIDLRVWGFTDRRIYDCGDATRPAVHDLFAGEGNNDAAALYHAAQVGRASRRRAKLLVMISDGAPTECTVEALRGLVKRLTARQGFLCAQVGVRPLEHITFPHHILLQDGNVDASVKRFGAVVMGLVRQALG